MGVSKAWDTMSNNPSWLFEDIATQNEVAIEPEKKLVFINMTLLYLGIHVFLSMPIPLSTFLALIQK